MSEIKKFVPRHGMENCIVQEHNGYIRVVQMIPGYDKMSEGYGVHGMDIRIYVGNIRGAVQFVTYTNWVPGRVDGIGMPGPNVFGPMGADVGFHEFYTEGQTRRYDCDPDPRECHISPTGQCMYEGSGLAAGDLLKTLVAEGLDAVWEYLEGRHREYFGTQERGPSIPKELESWDETG